MNPHQDQVALPFRSHTILGVCEAIGEDFGFNPIFLRVPLAASVLLSVTWAVVAYLTLGAIVLASRLAFPKARTVTDQPAEIAAGPANEQQEIARAA